MGRPKKNISLDELYNADRKKKYIESVSSDYFYILQRIFTASSNEERRLGKDLADFSKEQLMDLYSYMNVNSINTLVNIHSRIKGYISVSNPDFDPSIFQTTRAELIKRCNRLALEYRIITKEQLDEYHAQLLENPEYNACYSFLLYGLWEGISKTEDFLPLTKDDLEFKNGKHYIHLEDRTLEISKELFEYGVKSATTLSYIKRGRYGTPARHEYFPSNYIIKDDRRNANVSIKDPLKNRKQNIRRKFAKMFALLGIEKFISINSIVLSSQLAMLEQVAKENNMSQHELLNPYDKKFQAIAERYGCKTAPLKIQLLDYCGD